MRYPHLLRHLPRRFDIHQFTLADAGTSLPGFMPGPVRPEDLRPVRKRGALQRLRGVNRTPVCFQESALGIARHAQPPQIFCAKHIPLFEVGGSELEISREARDIVLRQINEALLLAALRTACLTLKANLQENPGYPPFCPIMPCGSLCGGSGPPPASQ